MNSIHLLRQARSEYLGERAMPVAVATLAKYAVLGGGPAFRKFGRRVLYPLDRLKGGALRLAEPANCPIIDAKGVGQREACCKAAQRWLSEGYSVRIGLSPIGRDFNGMLVGKA